jgi:hypothetical protein
MYCTSKQIDVLVMVLWSLINYEYNYSNIIYLDRGRLPKRGKYGKTSGWEDVLKQVIKDLGKIPAWRRGISRKTPASEQEHYLIQKDSVRIPGWEREYPGKLQAL